MKVILVMAMTLDGKIARHSLEAVDWTGKADKKIFVDITRKTGVMIMGSKTFDTIGRVLPNRKNVVMTRDHRRMSQNENLLFTDRSPEEVLKTLEDEGFESATLIGGTTINGLFAEKGLIDEVYLTIVPKLFGKGLSLFSVNLDLDLKLLEMTRIDADSILIRYSVLK